MWENKAIVDIRLHPSLELPPVSQFEYTKQHEVHGATMSYSGYIYLRRMRQRTQYRKIWCRPLNQKYV